MSRDLIFISLSLMTWGVGEGMFLFFQPLYLQELGARPLEIGAILGVIGVAMSVAHLPAGFLADRIGRRPLLIAAWFIGCLSAWLMALARTLPLFVAGSVLYSSTAFVMAPLNSYVTAARGNLSVGRALTLISAMYNIGAIIGPLLGGWIGDQAGLRSNFLIAACIFIASSLMIAFIRPQPLEKPSGDSGRKQITNLLNPRFQRYLLVTFLAIFCMYLPQPLSQNFLQNERGMNLLQIGQLLSARSAGIVLLNLILGQLNARTGYLIAHCAMASFSFLLWQGKGMAWFLPGYLLLGGFQTARALASAQGRALVQADNMGLAYGMIETVMASVIILAPPLAGLLYDLSPVLVYPVSMALILIALVSAILFSPH